jgi:hypothetical protein
MKRASGERLESAEMDLGRQTQFQTEIRMMSPRNAEMMIPILRLPA